jgi:hypothetical protein
MPTPTSLPPAPQFSASLSWESAEPELDIQLYQSAERVLKTWAQLPPRRVLHDPTAPLPELHAIATLIGERPGRLHVSAPPRLASVLAVASQSQPRGSGAMPDALLQFTALLRADFLHGRSQGFLQPAASWTVRAELPTQRPSAALQISVNGYPMVLRLWLDPLPA